jgi:recombination protein RecR
MQGPEIQRMIHVLSRLPGLGPRSGRRVALHLLKKRDQILQPLIDALQTAYASIQTCSVCFNLDTQNPCTLCCDPKREPHSLCVVADVSDIWALERARVFKGKYHVLGGLLSAMDGIEPKHLTIEALVERVRRAGVSEVVLALNATIDGQTTLHYVVEQLSPLSVSIFTLAHGVPMGGELDYLDDGTLTTAFLERKSVL